MEIVNLRGERLPCFEMMHIFVRLLVGISQSLFGIHIDGLLTVILISHVTLVMSLKIVSQYITSAKDFPSSVTNSDRPSPKWKTNW